MNRRLIIIALLLMIGLLPLAAHEGEDHSPKSEYFLKVATEPGTIIAGEPFDLTLQIIEPDGETPLTSYDIVHEKPLHLIIVKDDLTQFLHEHPTYRTEGRFLLNDLVLPESGTYVMYVDFTPTGGEQQVIRALLSTAEATTQKAALAVSAADVEVGGLNFHIHVPEGLAAGSPYELDFHVTDAATGADVADLETYLGAGGHLVIIDAFAQGYIHTHPSGEHDMAGMSQMAMSYGPEISFEATFPEGGLYKLWLQVRHQGEIYTAPFVIEVAAQSGEATPEASGHGHGHGG